MRQTNSPGVGRAPWTPLIVAHRGASRDAPENTLSAFRLAWRQGADAIECDLHLSSDGHVVCIHDADSFRVAGRKLVVRDATLEELRGLDVGGSRGAEFKGVGIPTFAEVLSTVPDGKILYIEIKCGVEIVAGLLEIIHASGLKSEQIVFISFREEVLQALKGRAPRIKSFLLLSLGQDLQGNRVPSTDSILATLKRIQVDGVSSDAIRGDEALIRVVRQAGFEYHVWTVDDPETARRFTRWGVQSITTNVPAEIRTWLGGEDPNGVNPSREPEE